MIRSVLTASVTFRGPHQISSPDWDKTLPAVDRLRNPQIVFAYGREGHHANEIMEGVCGRACGVAGELVQRFRTTEGPSGGQEYPH